MFYNLVEIFSPRFGGFIPHMLSQFDGGVGHIVAAALQTKGIIDQAKILENLTELNSIASLFYLFAIAMAIGSIAILGNYRQGIYLLVGPVLYTFMVTTTVETNGVMAKMGDYEIPNSIGRQTEFLRHIRLLDDKGGKKKVSLVFALVDGMVTEVVQEVTKLLVDTKNRNHLRFVARERALSYLLLDLPVDGPIPLLVSRHQAECAPAIRNYINAGVDTKRTLNAISRVRSDADVQIIKKKADESWKDFRMHLESGNDYEIKRFLKSMSGKPGFENINIADPADDFNPSCKDVWQWIGAIFQARAQRAFENDYYKGREESAPESSKQVVNDDVKNAIPVDYLAAHMYKNTISQSSNAQLQAQMFSNSPINAEDLSVAYRHHPGAHARGGYFGMKYFANAIPYLQGLLLYLLSIGFPFFAVLLVVPGKAMNFMMWISLWVWVKSWDVGFALVLVCKDMFWHILKHRNNAFDNGSIDWADPSSVFGVILNNDPLATQNLYFELSSFLTVSVPFLTAHFCLGATGMFEMFRNSIDQTSQRFRTWEQKSGTRERLNLVERTHPQLSAAINELVARHGQNMDSTGLTSGNNFIDGRGAQDSAGRAIARDTKQALFSNDVGGKIVGASPYHANATYALSDSWVKLGNEEYLDQHKLEMNTIDNFERDVNQGRASNAEIYPMPAGFREVGPTMNPNKTTLDENVSQKALEDYATRNKDNKDAIKLDQGISVRDFIMIDARQQEKRVILPHSFRGMPRLEEGVTIEELRTLKESAGSLEMLPGGSKVQELIARGERAEEIKIEMRKIDGQENKTDADKQKFENLKKELSGLGDFTLESVVSAGHEDFMKAVNYTGALSGRHYAPQVSAGVDSLSEAINHSIAISYKGRVLEVGSGSDANMQTFSNPFLQLLYNSATGSNAEEDSAKPGLENK